MQAEVRLSDCRGEHGMKRREFILALGCAAAWPLAARGQQPKLAQIGLLVLANADAENLSRELRLGLRDFGYSEGRNFVFQTRSAEGNTARLPHLASELVGLQVDVIVATFTPCALAAKQATATIPIVMAAVADPIGAGLVLSLARPGGNITGFSNMAAETAGKSVELFRDMLPSLNRVAVLANPADPFTGPFLKQVRLAGRTAGVGIQPVAMARGPDEVEAAFDAMAREGAEAVVVQGIFFSTTIAELALKRHLPTASVIRQFAQAGGLISYGADVRDIFRRSAAVVHKLLQGTKPADLPVELPTKFELVLNMKTAKALGIDVPWFFQQRADEVIE
jgi:putative tryptophan/tyrosine transport system substrate-binding protein